MKIGEIVYYCLDAIKAFSDDAYVNEDHIVFLLGKYRGALLQQYHNIKKIIPDSNYQVICLNLSKTKGIPCTATNAILKSAEEIPVLMTIGSPQVLLNNGMESENIVFVPFPRLKFVGHNNWKKNFIYVALGPDKHLYVNAINPQVKYLSSLRFRGIFEDYEAAAEMGCDECGCKKEPCDTMEIEFPIEVALVPDLIARVVRDALGALYKPADPKNDATDALSEIATFIRQNMKNRYQRAIEGDE